MTNTESRTALTAHTPGPWVILAVEQFIEICPAMRPGDICKVERDPFEGSAAANALLICAAPKMLAALQAAVHPKCVGMATAAQHFFRDNDASRDAIALIREAISEATGAVGDRESDATPQTVA